MQENRSYKWPIIGAVVIILALAGLTAFALSNQQPTVENDEAQTPTMSSGADPTTQSDEAVAGETATITFTNNGFEPRELTVKKGTVITVINESSSSVQFSSDEHPAHRDNPEMNMMVLAPRESDSYTAAKAGAWSFHDHLNESKTGTVTVTE